MKLKEARKILENLLAKENKMKNLFSVNEIKALIIGIERIKDVEDLEYEAGELDA